MSVVSLLGVNILNNPAKFTDNYQFEITFECVEDLEKGRQPRAHCPSTVTTLRCTDANCENRSRVEADLCRFCYL